jgi:hypothetical protein
MADKDDDKGEGGGSPDPKPAITFKTEADFLREIERKTKSATAKAAEEAKRALLEQLGLESDEDVPSIVETVKKSKTAATEADKLRSAFTKLEKEHKNTQEINGVLLNWKHTALKQGVLNAYASKTVDLEILAALVAPKLVIGDDDSVTGPNGVSVEEMVNGIFKAKPLLKAPDNTPGAGTKPGAKTDGKPTSKKDEEPKANGTPKTIGAAIVQAMKAQREGNP